jgi:hypothetical protein
MERPVMDITTVRMQEEVFVLVIDVIQREINYPRDIGRVRIYGVRRPKVRVVQVEENVSIKL